MSSDRRDFLKFLFGGAAAGMAMSPIELLIQSAIFQSQNVAYAQSQLEKFYMNIAFPFAPDRSTYDLFLDPYGNGQNITSSRGLATRFGSSANSTNRYDEAIYQTVNVAKHGIRAPWMWGQKMPTSDGFKHIHELMDNMILIQGIHSASPGHLMSQIRTEEANNLTVAGVLADRTATPLNAIQMNSPYSFKSAQGSFITPLLDSITQNVINNLMSQFNSNRISTYNSLQDQLSTSFKNAVDNLNFDSGSRNPSSLNMKKTYEGSLEILTSAVQNFESIWADKLSKYINVTKLAATDRSNFIGFFDKPIGSSAAARDNRYLAGIAGNLQAKCMDADIRSIVNEDTYTSMSASFAVAEFIADNKYASAINTRITSPMVKMTATAGGSPTSRAISHDQHNIGIMVRTLTNAVMYRSVSGCIYELRKFLQTESKGFKFDNTVIRLNGEFGRSLKADGSGSDHGWQATTSLIFSGMVKAPQILGRIYKDGAAKGIHGNEYKGSWGVGAPISINGVSTYLTQGHVISSLSTLLGIPSPAINSPSLIRLRSSNVEISDPSYKLQVVS